jgi:hypothetical protein
VLVRLADENAEVWLESHRLFFIGGEINQLPELLHGGDAIPHLPVPIVPLLWGYARPERTPLSRMQALTEIWRKL